jgi:hypothetical protein
MNIVLATETKLDESLHAQQEKYQRLFNEFSALENQLHQQQTDHDCVLEQH